MRSSGSADRLALDRDLPTTADDVAALGKARAARLVRLDVYIAFLRSFEPPAQERLRSRRGPMGPPLDLGR